MISWLKFTKKSRINSNISKFLLVSITRHIWKFATFLCVLVLKKVATINIGVINFVWFWNNCWKDLQLLKWNTFWTNKFQIVTFKISLSWCWNVTIRDRVLVIRYAFLDQVNKMQRLLGEPRPMWILDLYCLSHGSHPNLQYQAYPL